MAGVRQRCEPAYSIIQKLGGPKVVSTILNLSAPAITLWTTPKERKGRGGEIPQKRWAEILAFAYKHKINVTVDDLTGDSIRRNSAS